jgi:hypothetical protein
MEVESQPVERTVGSWCEMAASLGIKRVKLCNEGLEEMAL